MNLNSFFLFEPPRNSSNGTYAPEPGGNSKCFGCPGGKYVTAHAAPICDECPAGKFVNHTGEGYQCHECPAGRSSQSPSGLRTGLSQCIPCSRNNDRFRGGNFFFQDKVGQLECRRCKNSGAPGGLSCDEVSGEIIFSENHCWGLYTVLSNCEEAQDVYTSAGIAYGTFLFTLFVLLPVVFLGGGLASIAKVWRRDVAVAAMWMSNTTTNAYDVIEAKFFEKKRRWREKSVDAFFMEVWRRQQSRSQQQEVDAWFAPQRVEVDELLSQSLQERVGIGSNLFVTLLLKALRIESRRNQRQRRIVGDDAKLPVSLSKQQFRRFLSLVVQRLASARDLMRFRLVFMELAAGSRVITHEELEQRLPSVIGASALGTEDVKVLTRHIDRHSGTLDMNGFLAAMYFVTMDHKVRQLCTEKRSKDAHVRAVFLEHARIVNDDDGHAEDEQPYLGIRAFKIASIQLGLAWSLRAIREIQHAAKQRKASGVLPRHHWLLYATLEKLEAGIWHWLVVLPLLALALHFGSELSPFSDIVVPIVLMTEVFVRLRCFRGLQKSTCQFLAYSSSNAIDGTLSVLDVAVILCIVWGAPAGQHVASVARYARLARLMPVADALLPLKRMRHTLRRRVWGTQIEEEVDESILDEGKFRVTLDEFRRFVSVCKLQEAYERPVWPLPTYRFAFLEYDQDHGTHSGAVPLKKLRLLVRKSGHWPSPYQFARMKEVLKADDDSGVIYFDDFVKAVSIVRDEGIESTILGEHAGRSVVRSVGRSVGRSILKLSIHSQLNET